jgi:hypothetical protein
VLKISPIETKTEQEELSRICEVEYDADYLAYRAYEDDTFLGICQFKASAGHGIIRDLRAAPGIRDFEAMFIMGRAAMNFIDLLGVHTCICREGAGDERLLRSLGFRPDENGTLTADMTDMFSGHCGGHSVKLPKDE